MIERRRGAPGRLPRDQRRTQLLDAAGEVFSAKGYHAAAMDDIGVAAGVSKPVLYQHFGSKLELYLALLDTSIAQLLDVLTTALDSTDDNADRVTATMTTFFRYVADPAAGFRLIFESDQSGEAQVQQRLASFADAIADHLAQIIEADTELSGARAKVLAISLVGMAQVSARYWLSTPNQIPLTEAAQLVSTLAWRGIAGFPLVDHEP